MKKCLMVALLGFVVMGLAGCASVINGTTQKVPVTTSPTNATVTAVGGDKTVNGTAPCTLVLKRKYPQVLTITLPGYKTQTVKLEKVTSGAVAGNILAGGLIGWGVDAASGADSRLVPETIDVKLEPEQQAGPTVEKADALQSDLKCLDELLAGGKISRMNTPRSGRRRSRDIEGYLAP